MTRNSSVTGSAALLTVSLALCLGAAAEAAAATSVVRASDTGEKLAIGTRQRHALATLYANLTDAARKLQQAPQAVMVTRPPNAAPIEPDESAIALHRQPDRPHSLPTPPLREALLNLPPPMSR